MARFPGGKRFAFTVFDDTDASTAANVRPVYDLLAKLGFRTTKSVWPLKCDPASPQWGQSLEDSEYLEFVRGLQEAGFEIGFHGARNVSSTRQEVERAFEVFRRLLGQHPRSYANHMTNQENLYWGADRLSGAIPRLGYKLATLGKRRQFSGHRKGGERYWADVAGELKLFVRNLVFSETNLDRLNPTQPYYDPMKPEVFGWFSSTNGSDCPALCAALSRDKLGRLEEEQGVCIIYTHFACGFASGSKLDSGFISTMEDLAGRQGWFVPVTELLEFLLAERQLVRPSPIPARELQQMEWRWLREKFTQGTE